MKNYKKRLEKLEAAFGVGKHQQRIKLESMILDPDEEIPWKEIYVRRGNDKRKIYIMPSFEGEKKIVIF